MRACVRACVRVCVCVRVIFFLHKNVGYPGYGWDSMSPISADSDRTCSGQLTSGQRQAALDWLARKRADIVNGPFGAAESC